MNSTILGFLGFGEAAYNICLGLKESSRPRIFAYDVMWQDEKAGPVIRQRAEEAGVALLDAPEKLFAHVDLVLCATSAKLALKIAQAQSAFMNAGTLYADLNSASPAVKRRIAEVVESKGALFVDAAVMEIVPPFRHLVPIAASGSGAEKFTGLLNALGMKISFISVEAGSSSAMKMLRSVFMKGLTSLLVETLVASRKAGVTKQVMSSLTATIDGQGLESIANLLVNRTAVAAERRVAEMKDAVATLESLGLDAWASSATVRRLQWLCDIGLKEKLGGKVPSHYMDVLDVITGMYDSGEIKNQAKEE